MGLRYTVPEDCPLHGGFALGPYTCCCLFYLDVPPTLIFYTPQYILLLELWCFLFHICIGLRSRNYFLLLELLNKVIIKLLLLWGLLLVRMILVTKPVNTYKSFNTFFTASLPNPISCLQQHPTIYEKIASRGDVTVTQHCIFLKLEAYPLLPRTGREKLSKSLDTSTSILGEVSNKCPGFCKCLRFSKSGLATFSNSTGHQK